VLRIEELRDCLSLELSEQCKSRFEVAFRSLGYQDEYCRYHYEQYHKEHKLFLAAFRGKLSAEDIQNPQYYRLAFEANCFSFFRALHALIESIPYLLNILIGVKDDIESRHINWGCIINSSASSEFAGGVEKIKLLRASDSYQELDHISNVSKHRRIVRIDSGMFSQDNGARFCEEDFDKRFRTYQIGELMEIIYDELHPKALEVIKSFVR